MSKSKTDLNKFLSSPKKRSTDSTDPAEAAVKAIHNTDYTIDTDEKKNKKLVRLTIDLTEDQHLALKRYMLDNNKKFKRINSFLEYVVLREIGILKEEKNLLT